MLTAQSYHYAIYIYLACGVGVALCLTWWLGRRGWPGWSTLVLLLSLALLLTPAYPREGVDTMAPALVVAAFQYFTAGLDAAAHALRPLAAMCAAAVVLSALLKLLLFRGR